VSSKVNVELSQGDISMLLTVIRMGGWHSKKDLPKNLRKSDSKFIRKMSKIITKLEDSLEDD